MSNEAKKTVEVTETSFVDQVLGGESAKAESHSPATDDKDLTKVAKSQTPPVEENFELPDDDPEDSFEENTDSGKETEEASKESADEKEAQKKQLEETDTKLKTEIENLNKRLKDTQTAFHKNAEENKKLKKELGDLKTKKDKNDDWFSDEDKSRAAELEKRIEANDSANTAVEKQAKELEVEQLNVKWEMEAAKVEIEHKDFKDLVYNVLAPMLTPDSKEFDAVIASQYNKLSDKSPAAAYAFAKKVSEQQEFLKDPEAYKAKLRMEVTNNQPKMATVPTGKAGLDMINSASVPVNNKGSSDSFVDAIFK